MNKIENDFDILKRIMKLQKQSEKELLKIWHTMFEENSEIKGFSVSLVDEKGREQQRVR